MLKSFSQFINESIDSSEEFIKDLTQKLIKKIRDFREQASEYSVFSGMEFSEPYEFDLILNVRKESSAKIEKDPHFKSLSWEQLNYNDLGYAIDANIRTNRADLIIPELKIHIIVDPSKEPHLYTRLHARILDILTHETNHIDQFGIVNRNPFSANPSTGDFRNSAKKSYKYFLLPDEVESMVEGMYASSKDQKKPLDQVFYEYLSPFIKSKWINQSEYQKVISTWVKFALERYPDAKFSPNVKPIIDSI
jgi:hypothetical protein